jgi:5-methylcytosine-specific restriction endonuclease McrA
MNKPVVVKFFRANHPQECFYCGVKLLSLRMARLHPMAERVPELYTRDHVEPLCLGGGTRHTNIVPCCNRCNKVKGRLTLEQFRELRYGPGHPVEFHGERLFRLSLEVAR